jgi:hypothetical protein
MAEGSWVGLDVHARSVIAGVLDACGVRKLGPRSRKRGFAGETELTLHGLMERSQPGQPPLVVKVPKCSA